jgi:NADH-quinone oxidoreductase subunit J
VARTIGGAGILIAMIAALYLAMPEILEQPTTFPRATKGLGSVAAIGQHLFSIALAPFEITIALLLVAIVGGVALTRGNSSFAASRLTTKPRDQMFGGPVHPRDAGHPIVKGAKS